MDVGADEFEQSLPLLQELVLGADFLGLDIEFTGLRSNLSRPQQIRYVAHSCNFFLFPTTFGILDSEFSFQASSIQFLNRYGFDYNKFLKKGIPYMNEEQEKTIKHSILTGNWRVRSSLHKDQIKAVIDEVTRWLDLAEEGDWMTLPDIAESYDEFKLNIHNLFPILIDTKNVTKDIWKPAPPAVASASSSVVPFCVSSVPMPEPSFPLYLDVLAPYVNQVNLIRAGVPKINFSGPDYPSIRPPILILSVRSWRGVSEQQVYREFQNLCKFDVRRLTRSQFLLLTNKFKDARSVLKEYRGHPTLRVSLYRYWRHSPNINCLLQFTLGSLCTFRVLGGGSALLLSAPPPCPQKESLGFPGPPGPSLRGLLLPSPLLSCLLWFFSSRGLAFLLPLPSVILAAADAECPLSGQCVDCDSPMVRLSDGLFSDNCSKASWIRFHFRNLPPESPSEHIRGPDKAFWFYRRVSKSLPSEMRSDALSTEGSFLSAWPFALDGPGYPRSF
ncbi:poly(A)-specific ribonuclease-like domain containing protein [Camelus ferus]|nr:poly(A)-specific ribonuclease-like domain containing protein [Camelus ferus]